MCLNSQVIFNSKTLGFLWVMVRTFENSNDYLIRCRFSLFMSFECVCVFFFQIVSVCVFVTPALCRGSWIECVGERKVVHLLCRWVNIDFLFAPTAAQNNIQDGGIKVVHCTGTELLCLPQIETETME